MENKKTYTITFKENIEIDFDKLVSDINLFIKESIEEKINYDLCFDDSLFKINKDIIDEIRIEIARRLAFVEGE